MSTFSYSSRDFDTIKSDLLARANRVFPEWTDHDPSDFGMLFLDLWASAADVMHYYIDRGAGEYFLPTATQRESVLALANLLDYNPRGRSSAVGSVTLANSTDAPYDLPDGSKFVARFNDRTFQVYAPYGGTVPANGSTAIGVLEGNLVEDESLTSGASGLNNQRYSIASPNVVSESVRVFVYENGIDAVEYQQIRRVKDADSGSRSFSVEVTANSDTVVVFGDGISGFVPPSGCKITATYAASSGAAGNLPTNSVIAFRDNTPNGVSVSGSTAFSGGVDAESIDSLKSSIPSVISAQNRAVTRQDFVDLARQVTGVAKASITFTPSMSGNASVTVYPQVARSDYLTTADTSQTVDAATQTSVVETIQPRALLGVTVSCASTIQWDAVDIVATVHVNEKSVSNWVRRDVEAAIDTLFEFDNVFFGQRLTLGQIYRLILNVPGVDYANVTVFDNDGSALENSILIDPLELPKKGNITLTMSGGITTS